MPNTFSSQMMTAITTTTLRMLLIFESIGMNELMSQRMTPTTISAIITFSNDMVCAFKVRLKGTLKTRRWCYIFDGCILHYSFIGVSAVDVDGAACGYLINLISNLTVMPACDEFLKLFNFVYSWLLSLYFKIQNHEVMLVNFLNGFVAHRLVRLTIIGNRVAGKGCI